MRTIVFALHGFLGEPSDWNSVFAQVKKEKPDWELVAVDFMHEKSLTPDFDFENWSKNFSNYVESFGESRRIIVGYSMGGRLALHAIEYKPESWSSAVFVSTGPGLITEKEKQERIIHDQNWAQRFQSEELNRVLKDWNAQVIFSESYEPARHTTKLNPALLEKCLTNWSLSKQKNFRPVLEFFHIPQIWSAGAKDTKYCALLKSLPILPEIQKWEVEECGHRLIFEAPQEIAHFIVRSLGVK